MKYLFITILFFLAQFSLSFASEIYFQSPGNLNLDQSFELPVYLNSNHENINAVDLEIYFNNELLDFEGYSTSESFIRNWITTPYTKDNKIYFSFIVPGGIDGFYNAGENRINDIPIINLKFKTKNAGNISFIFIKNIVLKNDGLGNALILDKKDLNLEILALYQNKEDSLKKNNIDLDSPLPFEIKLIKSSSSAETDAMLYFDTNDKGTGVKEFRIKKWNKWVTIKNPYVLENNIFSKYIYIRAYDFQDNYTESSIFIKGFISFNLFLASLLLFLFTGFIGYKLLK